MTRNEIKLRFPNASPSFIIANTDPPLDGAGENPVMERAAGLEPLGKNQGQKTAAVRLHIRFVSVRKRLCDPDNLSAKWLLDCLRYCKAIDGDEPEKITLEVSQRKAIKGEQEHTVIEIDDHES